MNKNLKRLYFLLAFIYIGNSSFAQEKSKPIKEQSDREGIKIVPNKLDVQKPYDIRIPIVKAILTRSLIDSIYAMPENETHLVAVAISFKSNGAVDSIYFSDNMSPKLLNFIKPSDSLRKSISKNVTINQDYADKVIVFPILFNYSDHRSINKQGFLQDFLNLWPNLSHADRMKPVVLLRPYDQWIMVRH